MEFRIRNAFPSFTLNSLIFRVRSRLWKLKCGEVKTYSEGRLANHNSDRLHVLICQSLLDIKACCKHHFRRNKKPIFLHSPSNWVNDYLHEGHANQLTPPSPFSSCSREAFWMKVSSELAVMTNLSFHIKTCCQKSPNKFISNNSKKALQF